MSSVLWLTVIVLTCWFCSFTTSYHDHEAHHSHHDFHHDRHHDHHDHHVHGHRYHHDAHYDHDQHGHSYYDEDQYHHDDHGHGYHDDDHHYHGDHEDDEDHGKWKVFHPKTNTEGKQSDNTDTKSNDPKKDKSNLNAHVKKLVESHLNTFGKKNASSTDKIIEEKRKKYEEEIREIAKKVHGNEAGNQNLSQDEIHKLTAKHLKEIAELKNQTANVEKPKTKADLEKEKEHKKMMEHVEKMVKERTKEFKEQHEKEQKEKDKHTEKFMKEVKIHMEKMKTEKETRKKEEELKKGKDRKDLPPDISNKFKGKSVAEMAEERRRKVLLRSKELDEKTRQLEKELGFSIGGSFANENAKLNVGVKVLLQHYTLLLHSGRNCYHQSVLAGSNMTVYYMDTTNQGIPVTVLDKQERVLQEFPSNKSGTININSEYNGMYHICFTNFRWQPRKVFVVFEVEPFDAKNTKMNPSQRAFTSMVINVRRMRALLQYKKSKWSMDDQSQNDYVSLMNQRAWALLALALAIYALQVYAIHRVFNTPANGRLMALDKMSYRMTAKV